MTFDTLRVRTRLTIGFGAVLVLLLIATGFSLVALDSANRRFVDFVQGINARLLQANAVRTAVDRRAIAARNLVLVTSPQDLAQEKQDVQQAHADVQQRLARLKAMAGAPGVPDAVREKIAAIDKVEASYGPVALDIVRLALEGRHEEAIGKMNTQCRPLLAALVRASKDYAEFTAARSQSLVDEAEAQFVHQRNALLLACAAAIAAALVAGLRIARSLARALGAEPAALGAAADQVARGELHAIDGAHAAAAGSVMASLAAMQARLAAVVGQVRGASDSIATGATQIASGNADLSQRTEEQASNLQQTAASVEELTSTVRSNAETAQQAAQLASSACGAAARGGEVVGQMIATMEEISGRSREISEIIGVIDGIAFQTNLLALNAAVEAARAGEQGRGFAVVAGEVRTLARRSADAARDVKRLIGASAQSVEAGSALVARAGAGMEDIVQRVTRVTDLINEIGAATREQATGIEQVNGAVGQLDQVTQQNAALVEESAAAAESLRAQAERLVAAVSVFKLADGPAEAPAGASARPRPAAAPTPASRAVRGAAAATTWEAF